MDTEKYKRKIEIARSISEEFEEPYRSISFEIVLKKLLYQEKEDTFSPGEKLERTGKTLMDFISEKKVDMHSNLILCMAYYLLEFENIDPFNLEDIKQSYSLARQKEPANISDLLNKIENGKDFLKNSGKKDGLKAYSLTLSGIKYVEKLRGKENDIQ